MGNTSGRALRVTTFGESHGPAVGVVLDGVPPRTRIDLAAIQAWLDRRRPGASRLTSTRAEPDTARLLSGVQDGLALGTPITVVVDTVDARPADYAPTDALYRPSHADFTWDAKMGIRAASGGGRASARETVGRVAAGAIAAQVLAELGAGPIVAWVDEVCGDRASVDGDAVTRDAVEASAVRCPDPDASARFVAAIEAARKDGDTVGGVIRCVAHGIPAGLGEPVFDKLDADLAKALMSLPAAKGVEVGSGFAGTRLRGSQHNDPFVPDPARGIATTTNFSGGVQGGISNGMPVTVAVAFKPVATIFHPQDTVDDAGRPAVLRARGRHDPCVLPRAVPMVEAMVALVLADHWLRWRGQVGAPPPVPLRRPE
jgi:chorismate synthase